MSWFRIALLSDFCKSFNWTTWQKVCFISEECLEQITFAVCLSLKSSCWLVNVMNSYITLYWSHWLILEIQWKLLIFEFWKKGWINSNFVDIVVISFSDNVDSQLWFFMILLKDMWINFTHWYADKFPWPFSIIIRDQFWGLRSHEVWIVILERYQSLLLWWLWSLWTLISQVRTQVLKVASQDSWWWDSVANEKRTTAKRGKTRQRALGSFIGRHDHARCAVSQIRDMAVRTRVGSTGNGAWEDENLEYLLVASSGIFFGPLSAMRHLFLTLVKENGLSTVVPPSSDIVIWVPGIIRKPENLQGRG